MRNPKAKSLKERLTPEQQSQREERIKMNETFRNNVMKQQAIATGTAQAAYQNTIWLKQRYKRILWVSIIIWVALWVGIAGRLAGQW